MGHAARVAHRAAPRRSGVRRRPAAGLAGGAHRADRAHQNRQLAASEPAVAGPLRCPDPSLPGVPRWAYGLQRSRGPITRSMPDDLSSARRALLPRLAAGVTLLSHEAAAIAARDRVIGVLKLLAFTGAAIA